MVAAQNGRSRLGITRGGIARGGMVHRRIPSRERQRAVLPANAQKISFNANWICRDGYVVRMVPKAAAVVWVFGMPKFV